MIYIKLMTNKIESNDNDNKKKRVCLFSERIYTSTMIIYVVVPSFIGSSCQMYPFQCMRDCLVVFHEYMILFVIYIDAKR